MSIPNKKTINTETAVMLGLGLTTTIGQSQANLVDNITYSVEHIKNLNNSTADIELIFKEVDHLTGKLTELNIAIRSNIANKKINKNQFSHLLMLNQALSFGVDLLKNHYQEEILSQYIANFRALSAQKNRLELLIRQIQEKLEGVDIVQVPNLTLTGAEIEEINQSLGANA